MIYFLNDLNNIDFNADAFQQRKENLRKLTSTDDNYTLYDQQVRNNKTLRINIKNFKKYKKKYPDANETDLTYQKYVDSINENNLKRKKLADEIKSKVGKNNIPIETDKNEKFKSRKNKIRSFLKTRGKARINGYDEVGDLTSQINNTKNPELIKILRKEKSRIADYLTEDIGEYKGYNLKSWEKKNQPPINNKPPMKTFKLNKKILLGGAVLGATGLGATMIYKNFKKKKNA